jgi:putative ABC transport system ATP-binding protein
VTHPMTPLGRLGQFIRYERGIVWVVTCLAIGIGVLSLATPLAIQILINTVAFGALLQPILILAGLLTLCLSFSLLLRGMQHWAAELLQRRLWVRVSADLAAKLPRVKLEALSGKEGEGGAGLLNRFFDVLTLQKAASGLLIDGVSASLQALVGLILLAFYHPLLLGFNLFLFICVAIIFLLGVGGQQTAIMESKYKYKLAGWLQEGARSPLAFRTSGGDGLMIDRSLSLISTYLNGRSKHFKVLLRQLMGVFSVKLLSSALLLGLGGWLVMEKQLTLGQLVASELILTSVLAAFVKFGSKLESFYDLIAALDKLGDLLDLPLEQDGSLSPSSLSEGPLSISFESVRFRYAASPRLVLHDLCAHIRPRERVALVGPSGCGKRTALELLLGLHQPQAGVIRVGGFDLRDLSLQSLRAVVGLAEPEGVITGSVEENLLVGRADISPDDLKRALDTCSLNAAISALPRGLQTQLNASGAPLSRGQVARLLLARAILGSPKLLLIDALLDGLDDLSRAPLFDALFHPDAPWTLIVVTRDPEVMRRAERVWTLQAPTPELT